MRRRWTVVDLVFVAMIAGVGYWLWTSVSGRDLTLPDWAPAENGAGGIGHTIRGYGSTLCRKWGGC